MLRNVEEEEKEEMVDTHSEKLAIAFALLVSEPGTVIMVVKNLSVLGLSCCYKYDFRIRGKRDHC